MGAWVDERVDRCMYGCLDRKMDGWLCRIVGM